jgi:hypothetical protein
VLVLLALLAATLVSVAPSTVQAAAPAAGQATRYTMTAFTNSSESNMYVYESPDATGFNLLKGPAYTPPSGLIRDPSVFKFTDGYYYLTYTTGWTGNTIGFARSTDRENWTFLNNYTVPITDLARTWAPEWFIDTDGTVNIIVSADIDDPDVATDDDLIFKPYRLKATNSALVDSNTQLTEWSTPTVLAGIGPNYIDTFIVKIDKTYHAFTKQETTKYIEYATASSLTGPYTFQKTGNWAGFGSYVEGPALIQLDNGGWRIFFDGYTAGKYWYSDSYDSFATWSTPTELPGLTGTARHLTVIKETVSGGVTLPKDTIKSFQSVNYTSRYIVKRTDNLGYIDPVSSSSSTTVKKSATFTVVAGLADGNCYSLRDTAGNYMRHLDFRIHFDPNDGSDLFKKDATYCARPGSVTGSVRLESYNYAGRYVRHINSELRVDVYQDTDLFRADSSFTAVSPWAAVRLVNKNSGLELGISGASTANGAIATQQTADTSLNHQWQLEPAGDGYYKIFNRNSGKVLGISGMSTADGARALQWDDNGTADHLWKVVDDSGGYCKLVNKNSGKVLGIAGTPTGAGAEALQWSDNGTADHLWTLVVAN